MRRRSFFLAFFLTLCSSSLRANVPDSVYLFAYNTDPGRGLSFAWSGNGRTWKRIADGAAFVSSDYGAWGREKKMHTPVLMPAGDGSWILEFRLNDSANQYAVARSRDLIHWLPQDYPFLPTTEAVRQRFQTYDAGLHDGVIDGRTFRGSVNRVPYAMVEAMENAKIAQNERNRRNNESLADDQVRFKDLLSQRVTARVAIDGAAPMAISDKLLGIFFEDINYSADGGLYAELLQNRDFEYDPKDGGREPNWTPTNSWAVSGEGMTFAIATDEPLHANQQHYAVLDVTTPGAALENDGFDGIVVRKGERYDVSLFARQLSGKVGKLRVQLRQADRIIGETTLAAPSASWRQMKAVITAKEDAADAHLLIQPTAAGRVAIDFVSLFPQKTFKHRKNGMRADLAQSLADLHPRFMRFPGGCVTHGDGLGNIYHWKQTIGPMWERQPLRNIWGYHQTRGLGFFEFFQFCEDLGCEPLPVLAAGVPCQNSSTGGGGQQGGIPFGPEFEQYKQDILDLIEWANGDPKNSKWARMRAEAGHPKPFNLKYLGIGNEDLISEVFTERYLAIIEAVKQRYPDIIVCGTVGSFFEGSDYEQGWRLAKDNHIDMVDEHYYVAPGWYINNQDYYDHYDRSASKVYLGEYASHGPGRKSTIQTALTCALHILNLERNGDVVAMSSYAPLLAKHGHTQWNPDLIYFDNATVYPTVDYYAQLLCGQSQGDRYLPTTITAAHQPDGQSRSLSPEASRRLVASTVHDSRTGRTYVKLVNLLPVAVDAQLDAAALTLPATARITTLSGNWDATDAKPQPSTLTSLTPFLSLPPYSLVVIEF